MNLREKWRDFLCWIGWHDWSTFPMPCPTHCMNCLITPDGTPLDEVLDAAEEINETY